MHVILLAIFVVVSVSLITLIMIQQRKKNDIGISYFKSSDSNALFSSSSSNKFMIRIITIFAIFFFVISLVLNNTNFHKSTIEVKKENSNAKKGTSFLKKSIN